ncbi:MAG: hypothetical protein ACOX6T_21085, partial [Myxococcales bacterium]
RDATGAPMLDVCDDSRTKLRWMGIATTYVAQTLTGRSDFSRFLPMVFHSRSCELKVSRANTRSGSSHHDGESARTYLQVAGRGWTFDSTDEVHQLRLRRKHGEVAQRLGGALKALSDTVGVAGDRIDAQRAATTKTLALVAKNQSERRSRQPCSPLRIAAGDRPIHSPRAARLRFSTHAKEATTPASKR